MIDIIRKQMTKDYKRTMIFEDGKLIISSGEITSTIALNCNIEHLSGLFYGGDILFYWNFDIKVLVEMIDEIYKQIGDFGCCKIMFYNGIMESKHNTILLFDFNDCFHGESFNYGTDTLFFSTIDYWWFGEHLR